MKSDFPIPAPHFEATCLSLTQTITAFCSPIGRAECVRCPWLLAQTKVATILGIFFSSFLVVGTLLAFTQEGIIVGF